MNQKNIFFILISVILISGCSSSQDNTNSKNFGKIEDSFENCINEGGTILESYPKQCRINNETFLENINQEPTLNLIEEENSNEKTIRGKITKVTQDKFIYTVFLEDIYTQDNLVARINLSNENIRINSQDLIKDSIIEINGEKSTLGKFEISYGIVIFSEFQRQLCINKNGEYEAFGLLQVYQCNENAKDFGNLCTDSSECEGICLVEGVCSKKTLNFGCIEILEQGDKVTLCID